jgi:cyclopropane-fatty-acyl-phospholipid synthase
MTTDHHGAAYLWSLLKPLLFGQTRMDRSGISSHYDNSQEFYLSFLDQRHRCYSQGVFMRDDEPIEDAMTRKLQFAVDAVGTKPGDRVLDIGGGWGAFSEYAGKRGAHVTSLTISKESESFLRELSAREQLPCEVVNCHLYEYDPGMQFDAIVNLGVTEHLPDYGRSLATYRRLLKPGGKIYLDASACRQKYKFHSFIYKHIYPGNCSPLCLHDYLTELSKTPFRLRGIWDDRHSYYLTARHWAQNLERNRDEIVRNSDECTFRKFQVYLWGTVDVFRRDVMQAYRWVLELPSGDGGSAIDQAAAIKRQIEGC